MTTLNNIKTLDLHYFQAPNNLIVWNNHNIITAELTDLTFEDNFIIDNKSFEMLKKLKTNRKLKVANNTLTIKSDEGKYKCNLIETTPPAINNEEIIYSSTYNLNVLKKAISFINQADTRPILTGVLFDNVGNVYGTDVIKMFKYGENLGHTRFWSVPSVFINLINENDCTLEFTASKVIFKGEYNVYGSLYSGNVPDINQVIKIARDNPHKIEFYKNDAFKYYASDSVDIDIYTDRVEFIFKDDINEFKVVCDSTNDFEDKLKIGYSHFNTLINSFSDKIVMYIRESNKPIYLKNGLEQIVIMPMTRGK